MSPVVRNRIGVVLSTLAVLFLLLDSAMKFSGMAPVVDSFRELGYPISLAGPIGAIQLACLVLYIVPRTSVLGVVLLTGYLGGAIATHVRIGNPLLTHQLFPIYLAALLWGGLYLREPRLAALLPLRS